MKSTAVMVTQSKIFQLSIEPQLSQCVWRGPPECWQDPPTVILRMSWLAHLALSLNSSMNFLVYVFWGTKFRVEFCKIFRDLLRRVQSLFRNNGNSSDK